jgi:hypothetical protein
MEVKESILGGNDHVRVGFSRQFQTVGFADVSVLLLGASLALAFFALALSSWFIFLRRFMFLPE